MSSNLYTCPCCGHKTLSEFPGSHSICPVCFWEDDQVQFLNVTYRGGANIVSLLEAQENFVQYGASEECFVDKVRKPSSSEVRDSQWRPASINDAQDKKSPAQLSESEFQDLKTWYYWLRDA